MVEQHHIGPLQSSERPKLRALNTKINIDLNSKQLTIQTVFGQLHVVRRNAGSRTEECRIDPVLNVNVARQRAHVGFEDSGTTSID